MKVLIDVAGFVNRGDQLMFCAIVEAVRKRLPNADLVIPANLFKSPALHKLCPTYSFQELADCRRFSRKCRYAFRWLLSCLKVCNTPVWPWQVDVVLHSPGFRYSDSFPLRHERSLRKEVQYFRMFSKKGRRIFFLPQAFGPFATKGAQRRMSAIRPYADWIYARDATSFTYLQKLTPPIGGNVSIAPDFTCGCSECLPVGFSLKRYGVIVPNGKMITHTTLGSSAYLNFLCLVASLFYKNGLSVTLLNHEGEDDKKIIELLRNRVPIPVECLNDVTGLECKGIIGGASIVLTSRFHGAVSGFCQGVSTLCTGWSHKYRELAERFGCPNNCLDVSNADKALAIVADALNHPCQYAADQSHISDVISETSKMWDSIFAMISEEHSDESNP